MLDPQTILAAYANGAFPMTDDDGVTRWYTADPRGVLPLETFHVPSTLRQLMRKNPPVFEVRINGDFRATMEACSQAREDGTWISPELIDAYVRLHELGAAHSVECFYKGDLAGGLYGVGLGAAFFGESMFHRRRDASKVALVHLVQRLRSRGFELLDTQTMTSHLRQFGGATIPAQEYLKRLKKALAKECSFA
jgi:leucyl/phenylalanyl-tRNA--protein transferase